MKVGSMAEGLVMQKAGCSVLSLVRKTASMMVHQKHLGSRSASMMAARRR